MLALLLIASAVQQLVAYLASSLISSLTVSAPTALVGITSLQQYAIYALALARPAQYPILTVLAAPLDLSSTTLTAFQHVQLVSTQTLHPVLPVLQ